MEFPFAELEFTINASALAFLNHFLKITCEVKYSVVGEGITKVFVQLISPDYCLLQELLRLAVNEADH